MDEKALLDKVTPFHKEEFSTEEKIKMYDEWSPTYQKTLGKEGLKYTGPMKCAEIACNYFPDDRENIVVLDVGTGTGLAAEEMHKKGFKIIDGLDPSKGMLDEATKKDIFRNLYCSFITAEQTPSLVTAKYDLLTVVGSFISGHIPYDAIQEMIRLTKPGGIICIVNRRLPFQQLPEYAENFFSLCKQLEQEGKLKQEEVTVFDSFVGKGKQDGIVIVHRVLETN